jgi:hypothetical protein
VRKNKKLSLVNFLSRLHGTRLRLSTSRGSDLDLLDDFFSAVGSDGELVLKLTHLGLRFFLLVRLDAFDPLLMFLVVSLCFLLGLVLEG